MNSIGNSEDAVNIVIRLRTIMIGVIFISGEPNNTLSDIHKTHKTSVIWKIPQSFDQWLQFSAYTFDHSFFHF